MPKYTCDICNYNTYRLPDAMRHKKTKKHLRNVGNKYITKDTEIIPKKLLDKLTCEFCMNKYSCYGSLWRHKKYYCELVDDEPENVEIVEELYNDTIKSTDRIRSNKVSNKNKLIELLKKENDQLKDEITSLKEEIEELKKQIPKKFIRKQIPKAVKRAVWNKHIGEELGNGLCKCCNKTNITQLTFHCGHITAVTNGGTNHMDNLLPICQLCNNSMYQTNLFEFQKDLIDNDINANEKKPTKISSKHTTK